MATTIEGGLRDLKNLKQIVISGHIAQDGLNASSLFYGFGYERERQARGMYTLVKDSIGRAAKSLLRRKETTGCIDILFKAIQGSKVRLRNLSIGNGHENQLDEKIQSGEAPDSADIVPIVWKLNSLSVSCMDSDEEQYGERSQFWRNIAESANGLSELTLYTGRALYAWRTPGDGARALDHFLDFGDYPSLRTIRIIGAYTKPNLVNAHGLLKFLRRHRDTLQHVEISGILFSIAEAGEDVCVTIKNFLIWVVLNLDKLTSFKMSVHRRDEHGDGECLIYGKNEPCDETCEKYLLHHGEWMHRSSLEQLASKLGVVLRNGTLQLESEDDWGLGRFRGGHWDFGDYVMRERANQNAECGRSSFRESPKAALRFKGTVDDQTTPLHGSASELWWSDS